MVKVKVKRKMQTTIIILILKAPIYIFCGRLRLKLTTAKIGMLQITIIALASVRNVDKITGYKFRGSD